VTEVHVVVPEGIDDPARPSGGNTLRPPGLPRARRARLGGARARRARRLAAAGEAGHAALARAVRRIPDGAVVLLDGLIASAAPEALVPQARRLRQVVLVHMPLGHRPPDDEAGAVRAREREVLAAAAAVVTTSAGPGAGWGSCTRCRPTGCTWPSRASTPPASRRGPRPATRCSASRR
jgi:hypothetical protein